MIEGAEKYLGTGTTFILEQAIFSIKRAVQFLDEEIKEIFF